MTSPEETLLRPYADGAWASQERLSKGLYWLIHLLALATLFFAPSGLDLALCGAMVMGRMFFITAGYHRYFAHRTYRTGRIFQFLLAFGGASSIQKGPLWWAAGHRRHHQFTDRPGDLHSPREGFWYSHQGWIFDDRWGTTELTRIRDFEKVPELVWLNRWHVVAPVFAGLLCWAIGGWSGLAWGFVVSTVILWHLTYSVNSVCHVWGTRRYDTPDTSRNNFLVGLLTLGEGWHNNHHHYMTSTRQGFLWWEIDITYYVLKGLERLGLVWDLRVPPPHVVRPPAASTTP